LIACAERKPLRHRLNALAVARTDQSRHVERAHLSPCFVTQPIQKRLEPTAELVSPIRRPANHGRPLQKAGHPRVTEKVIGESRAREKSAKVVLVSSLGVSFVSRPSQSHYSPPPFSCDRPDPTSRP